MAVSVWGCLHYGPMAAQHHDSTVSPIASQEKGSNSKFEVWFLLNVCGFHTITKLKKSDDGKSGTV